jgi:hypothetical protein
MERGRRGSARKKLKRSGVNPPHPRHPRSINQYIEMKIASGPELFQSTAKNEITVGGKPCFALKL